MEKFAAVFKKVQKINKAIIGAVLLLMIGVVFLQTFCRRNFPDICLWH